MKTGLSSKSSVSVPACKLPDPSGLWWSQSHSSWKNWTAAELDPGLPFHSRGDLVVSSVQQAQFLCHQILFDTKLKQLLAISTHKRNNNKTAACPLSATHTQCRVYQVLVIFPPSALSKTSKTIDVTENQIKKKNNVYRSLNVSDGQQWLVIGRFRLLQMWAWTELSLLWSWSKHEVKGRRWLLLPWDRMM